MTILDKPLALRNHLSQFKTHGVIAYDKVLAVPSHDRIVALTKLYGEDKMAEYLSGAIAVAVRGLNLRLGLTAKQTVELAATILEEAAEDNLAMEDVLLFLQNLVRGKAGKLYDRLDVAVFMELFDEYRQERHRAYKRIKEEQDAQYRASDDKTRSSEQRDPNKLAINEHLKQYGANSRYNHQSGAPAADQPER